MAKFHFKIRDGSYVREADYEIPDELLKPPPHMIFDKRFNDPRELLRYRHNIINQHLQKWALRYTNPTWREIHHEQIDGHHADNEHREASQQPPSET